MDEAGPELGGQLGVPRQLGHQRRHHPAGVGRPQVVHEAPHEEEQVLPGGAGVRRLRAALPTGGQRVHHQGRLARPSPVDRGRSQDIKISGDPIALALVSTGRIRIEDAIADGELRVSPEVPEGLAEALNIYAP